MSETTTETGYEDGDDFGLDLGTCPYYAHYRHNAPFGTCSFGCWDEPRCITDEPEEGWVSAPLVAAQDGTSGEQQ